MKDKNSHMLNFGYCTVCLQYSTGVDSLFLEVQFSTGDLEENKSCDCQVTVM